MITTIWFMDQSYGKFTKKSKLFLTLAKICTETKKLLKKNSLTSKYSIICVTDFGYFLISIFIRILYLPKNRIQ